MPKRILYNSRFKYAGHAVFWTASIALMLFFFFYNEKKIHFDLITLTKAIIINIGFAIGVYFNLYFLIPRFLKPKSYIFYIFWLIVLLSFSSLVIQLLLIFPLRNILHLNQQYRFLDTNLHSAYFFATFIYVVITSFLKFIKDWFSLQDLNFKLVKIEQQKLEAELNTLKGQLNPHFLFNSLNNIYSLALIKSDKVPELILKLSDLMRHIIYESKENFISLHKEIEFVDNFIALQKIRTNERTKIEYELVGTIPDAQIAPLLFEPFIDNAFKHGLPGSENSDFISIKFDFTQPGTLFFLINNYFEETGAIKTKSSGIGLNNVKQRLKHLYNEDEYTLNVSKKENLFSVSLLLKLK